MYAESVTRSEGGKPYFFPLGILCTKECEVTYFSGFFLLSFNKDKIRKIIKQMFCQETTFQKTQKNIHGFFCRILVIFRTCVDFFPCFFGRVREGTISPSFFPLDLSLPPCPGWVCLSLKKALVYVSPPTPSYEKEERKTLPQRAREDRDRIFPSGDSRRCTCSEFPSKFN